MPYEERKQLMTEIEKIRNGRRLVALCTFDRVSVPELPGLLTQFNTDLKESLYRVLKESGIGNGLDIFLYTRGGDTNSVWPIVSLLREFDPEFEVLVPFRAHSAGTMLALAGKKIVMTRIGELSPIDPSTGNQFNPQDPQNPQNRLGISVEDVKAYKDFVGEAFGIGRPENDDQKMTPEERQVFHPYIQRLTAEIHPIALGNVHRVHKLIQRLAAKLLACNPIENRDNKKVVDKLTVEPRSHLHMFNRAEVREILSEQQVVFADEKLDAALDLLLREYENNFRLRSPLFAPELMKGVREKEVVFVGGAVESPIWGYLFKTRAKIVAFSRLPANVNVQLPPGQPMPLVPGLPSEFAIEMYGQAWEHNKKPEGVTV